MAQLPDPIQNAASAFDGLPGVGPRAALRYAYFLVTQPREVVERFSRALQGLADQIRTCSICGQWSDRSPCAICSDPARETSTLCVIATSPDVRSVEETGVFKGRYHVLGGTIDPIEGRTPDTLHIAQLVSRLKATPTITEVILALDTDVPGDVTSLYIRKQLESLPVKVTRLARGLPTGAALEYADAHTLADALKNRSE
jgi:recombination protein RecR